MQAVESAPSVVVPGKPPQPPRTAVTQRFLAPDAASAEESAPTAEELTARSALLEQAVEPIAAMTGVH